MSFDFDAWRAGYDYMTYADHLDCYSQFFEMYPVQKHFDASACAQFLATTNPTSVLEIGGWTGDLAALMLIGNNEIETWLNVEICTEAAQASACDDERYAAVVPYDFVWNLPITGSFDALVMSHVAEHMRWPELHAILANVSTRSVFMAAPLSDEGRDWQGYEGTHILEVGWRQINDLCESLGFNPIPPTTHEVRCWSR